MKTCSKCGVPKSLDAFYRWAKAPDGLRSQCKECFRLYSAEYRKNHVEEVRASKARSAQKYRAGRRVYTKRYRTVHAGEIRAANARYRRDHPDKTRQWGARYHATHPEACRKRSRLRRARARGVSECFTAEMEAFVLGFWGYRCAACGSDRDLCMDHWLPLHLGYALAVNNAVVLCRRCNRSKGPNLPKDVYDSPFVTFIQRDLEEQTYQWESLTPVL